MFVLRSAFWLTIGFLLVAPHGVDLGATASSLRDRAVAAGIDAGERLIVGQLAEPATMARLVAPALARAAAATAEAPVMPQRRPPALG